MKTLTQPLLVASLLALACVGAQAEENTLKEGVKDGAKAVAETTVEVAKKVGEEGKKAGKVIANTSKEVGQKVADTAVEVGGKVRDGSKEAVQTVKQKAQTVRSQPDSQSSASSANLHAK